MIKKHRNKNTSVNLVRVFSYGPDHTGIVDGRGPEGVREAGKGKKIQYMKENDYFCAVKFKKT